MNLVKILKKKQVAQFFDPFGLARPAQEGKEILGAPKIQLATNKTRVGAIILNVLCIGTFTGFSFILEVENNTFLFRN